jgi:hypothetical protein
MLGCQIAPQWFENEICMLVTVLFVSVGRVFIFHVPLDHNQAGPVNNSGQLNECLVFWGTCLLTCLFPHRWSLWLTHRQLCSYIWPSVLCLCGVSKCHGQHHEETKYESVPTTNFLSSTSSYMTHSVVSSASNWTLVRVTVPFRHCSGAIFEVIFVITSNTMAIIPCILWECMNENSLVGLAQRVHAKSS